MNEDDKQKSEAVTRHTAILEQFKAEVCDRWRDVDPDDERDWYCLSVGYFIAKGVPLDDVSWLAIYSRYDAQYWGAGK